MKKILVSVLLFVSLYSSAQTEISRDASGHKIVKGFMSKKDISSDTAFAWYAQNLNGFTPNADAVKRYAANKDSVNFIVFGGTWCGDTQSLLPKFFSTTYAAGIADNHITLIGVDRDKKTLYNLTEAFAVTNVPTFIVMKNGKEIGRVVEYGRTGSPDKEVAEIISNVSAK